MMRFAPLVRLKNKARKAGEAVAKMEAQMTDVTARMDQLIGRIELLSWMLGVNLTASMLMLGKSLLIH